MVLITQKNHQNWVSYHFVAKLCHSKPLKLLLDLKDQLLDDMEVPFSSKPHPILTILALFGVLKDI